MKIVIQRSKAARVEVEQKIVGSIEKGMVLLVCMEKGDSELTIEKAVAKISNLRIFPDENGRMNKSLTDFGGSILAISQFTLSWDGARGNRPSFDNSMPPEEAESAFENFCQRLEGNGFEVEKGQFGAMMEVFIQNSGPVTFSFSF